MSGDHKILMTPPCAWRSLGSMAYHNKRFHDARTHLHTAETDAPDLEKGRAVEMLSWRWQE
jgi:uncharacterized protein HemY